VSRHLIGCAVHVAPVQRPLGDIRCTEHATPYWDQPQEPLHFRTMSEALTGLEIRNLIPLRALLIDGSSTKGKAMKRSTLALASAFALTASLALAQNSPSGGGAATGSPAATTTTGSSTHGANLGSSMPGTNAGVPRPGSTDAAMPAGNANNSGAAPDPSSRISPGPKNEATGP
jgi:hypothetical protein